MFSAIVLILLGVQWILFKAQNKQKDLISRSSANQHNELVNTTIAVKSNQLTQLVEDFTIWDDLIENIINPDQNWATDNIGTSVVSFKLYSIDIYNLNLTGIYQFGNGLTLSYPETENRNRILQLIKSQGSVHFFKNTPSGIVEVVGSTIHPTDDTAHKTPAAGIFILTKLWDAEYLEELSKNTLSQISISTAENAGKFHFKADSLIVYKTLLCESADKTIVIAFKKPNRALYDYNRINNLLFIFIGLSLIIIILGFFIILHRWVQQPLKIISGSLRSGMSAGLMKLEKNRDEFSEIAKLINGYHQQQTELQNENSERRLSQNRLLRQSNLLQGMAEASNLLLTGENPDISVMKALETIGLNAGIDRIFVYRNDTDKATGIRKVKRMYDWTSGAVNAVIENSEVEEFVYIHVDNIWYYPLFERKALTGITSQFPKDQKEMFSRQHIKSLIVVPIIDKEDDTFWGIVGFADCTNEHEWSKSEEHSLRMLADNIRNSIRRFESQENLQKALVRAQAADRAKSEFLASMSHEIRTPMNGVFGMTSLLQHTDLTEQQREYVDVIEKSGDNLMGIINEILDFSKIESGHMQLENTSFDLRQCIEDVLDLVAPKALEKRLDIMYLIDPEVDQYIFGDGFRLRQIFVNLIGNAIKFTESGEIYLHVLLRNIVADKVTLEFSIRDTGIGIAADKISDLFSPFTQADNTTTRKYGGTGLGLAISARLAALMGGTIWAESNEGKGSDFRFTIETRFTSNENRLNQEHQLMKNLKGKRVLIVDDNLTNRKVLTLQCEFWGLKTVAAESGKMALELLETDRSFDVGILDMQMPEMDGVTLARTIRKQIEAVDLPLIMLTSIGFHMQADEIHNLFAHYVNKPIKHSQLASILLKVLSPSMLNTDRVKMQEEDLALTALSYPCEILVAEDNSINQKMIRNVLQLFGYTTDLAANGLEVIEAVKRKHYQLIFMDIQMPEMDGYEATRIILEHMHSKQPVIIAMTANAMQSDRDKCLSVGMSDFISKPLKVDDVKKIFEKWGERIISGTSKGKISI